MPRKASLPAYGAEILAEVVRQHQPAQAGPSSMFLHVGSVWGLVVRRWNKGEDPAAENAGAGWEAQPPTPTGTVQEGEGLQLAEVGSCE